MSFVPKNHRQQVGARGADDKTDDRRTPDSIFLPLHEEHGFTLDVAASASNTRCERFLDRQINGLEASWADEIVWCNPPYSDLRAWVEKALREVQSGCRRVVMLLPANRTEQAWWQDLIEPVRDRPGTGVTTRMLRGRPKFQTPSGAPLKPAKPRGLRTHGGGTRPPFGCVVVIIEPVEEVRRVG